MVHTEDFKGARLAFANDGSGWACYVSLLSNPGKRVACVGDFDVYADCRKAACEWVSLNAPLAEVRP